MGYSPSTLLFLEYKPPADEVAQNACSQGSCNPNVDIGEGWHRCCWRDRRRVSRATLVYYRAVGDSVIVPQPAVY